MTSDPNDEIPEMGEDVTFAQECVKNMQELSGNDFRVILLHMIQALDASKVAIHPQQLLYSLADAFKDVAEFNKQERVREKIRESITAPEPKQGNGTTTITFGDLAKKQRLIL